jgi:hypothetical protein
MSTADLPVIKTTIRIYKTVWDQVRIRAIEASTTAEDIVEQACRYYLENTRVARVKVQKGGRS